MSHVHPERSINWHMGWPDEKGPFSTEMVEQAVLAHQKPLAELDIDEIRLLISQGCALEYTVPLGVTVLEARPLASGYIATGDLLSACLRIDVEFWKKNDALMERLKKLLSNLRTTDSELNQMIEKFLKQEPEISKRGGKPEKAKGSTP